MISADSNVNAANQIPSKPQMRAAFLTFEILCGDRGGESPLGASDYIALANAFPIIYLASVPTLSILHRNEVSAVIDRLCEILTINSLTVSLCLAASFHNSH
jgi:predicted ATPase